jgi:hypothetical protein
VALGRLRHRNDAPLIGERAATRGPSATEGGDERASVQRRIPSSSSFGGSRDAALPAGLDERFASAHGRLGRRNDVPLIGKRAATGGRGATEGAGAKSALSFEREPRETDRTAGTLSRGRRSMAPPASHAATPAANDAARDAHAGR